MIRIIDENQIVDLIERHSKPSRDDVDRILSKGALKKGLSLEDVAFLVNADRADEINKIFNTASKIKDEIYGERLVLFAPLYISDHCVNDCVYCGFHLTNETLKRRMLSQEEIAAETKCLIDMGHKRVLIEFGEDPDRNTIDYICDSIRTIYSVKSGNGNIRRVNVNIASTTVDDYRRLKAENIGTYQLFQETYHRETYEKLHRGPKADYDRQITAHDRAREAGMDDMGIGVLFGLYDWKFEVMALVAHAAYMEKNLGVGPHTISVPRFRSGQGIRYEPAYPVSDDDFLKLIAILRIAVPYTGMILSTREPAWLRRRAFQLGISQASAASVCTPGGYSMKNMARSPALGQLSPDTNAGTAKNNAQFNVADDRPVDEIISSVIADGLIPSFCTACYRIGRTGESFMELAKPGEIHNFCRPNALLTFAEYLEDYGNKETKEKGELLIERYLNEITDPRLRESTKGRLEEIKTGKRDLFF